MQYDSAYFDVLINEMSHNRTPIRNAIKNGHVLKSFHYYPLSIKCYYYRSHNTSVERDKNIIANNCFNKSKCTWTFTTGTKVN